MSRVVHKKRLINSDRRISKNPLCPTAMVTPTDSIPEYQ